MFGTDRLRRHFSPLSPNFPTAWKRVHAEHPKSREVWRSTSWMQRCSMRQTFPTYTPGLTNMLFQEADEALRQGGDLLGGTFVFELARGIKGFVGFGQSDLIRQDDDADVSQDGTQMNEAAQAAEGSG